MLRKKEDYLFLILFLIFNFNLIFNITSYGNKAFRNKKQDNKTFILFFCFYAVFVYILGKNKTCISSFVTNLSQILHYTCSSKVNYIQTATANLA